VAFEVWSSGVPILSDCLANFECTLLDVHNGGDHRIFVGQVGRMHHSEAGKPLLHWRGNYAKLGEFSE
jgi:flavin reductase (DIM6/NTAB) family NADH-FMN oxidoreductase RutF